jgi:hypothetical protein
MEGSQPSGKVSNDNEKRVDCFSRLTFLLRSAYVLSACKLQSIAIDHPESSILQKEALLNIGKTEWLFCLSIMFEHMSIAQVRVNVSFEILTVNGSPKRKEEEKKKEKFNL